MAGKFCGEAWDAISRYVYTALHGGTIMHKWTNDERMMIACCNDGTRPVIFKIERIDIPETAFVILNYNDKDSDTVEFNTMSGKLTVTKKDELYEMDFPTYDLQEIPVTDEREQAFGVRPSKALLAMDMICVFDSEEVVRTMQSE